MKISSTRKSASILLTILLFTIRHHNVSSFVVHPSAFTTSRALAAIEVVNVGEKVVTPPNDQGPCSVGGSRRRRADANPIAIIHGGSLRTWTFDGPSRAERVQVVLTTDGRPLNADVDLWYGPDNTPQKMAVYCEDGALRPFNAIIETPRGQNTVAVRNTANMAYPLAASVAVGGIESISGTDKIPQNARTEAKRIQGGAIKTYMFGSSVESVQVLLTTDGRPLNARIELLQGPNNDKQVVDIYTEDGLERPFYAVIETPGTGNVFRIVNTAPLEYPLSVMVDPYSIVDPDGVDNGEQSATRSSSSSVETANDNSRFFFLK